MDRIVAEGFREGASNTHPGQWTACRRLFFENLYIELIWLVDPVEAASPPVDRIGLAARTQMIPGASRLGIAFNLVSQRQGGLPVETWEYRPSYLTGDDPIKIAANSTRISEPLIFFIPGGRIWSPDMTVHPNGAREVTDICFTLLPGSSSPEVRWLRESDCLRVESGTDELVAVELDHSAQEAWLDLRPSLPLILRW